MQIFSIGNLYIGTDDTSYCNIDIHLGIFRIEFSRPVQQINGSQPSEGINRRQD